MKISYLSGAYKNAGDYLIEERTVRLINYVYPDCVINKFLRNEITNKINDINKSDIVVFGGGPIYLRELESYMDVNTCIDKINKPIVIIGGGWYGMNASTSVSTHYMFSDTTMKFFKKIDSQGYGLGCRDIYTELALKNAGFKNVVMTGCPAWYDIDTIHNDTISSKPIKLITVSDPALPINYPLSYEVVRLLREKYNDAMIKYVFHRGIRLDEKKCAATIRDLRTIQNVEIVDISDSADGFHVYDDSDLHVGFRVHAHIYNLSKRNKTILIEEDGRGAGVDEALGLISIKAYNDEIMNEFVQKVLRKVAFRYSNNKIGIEINNYLDLLESVDYQYLKNAFIMQKKYFSVMIDYLQRIHI